MALALWAYRNRDRTPTNIVPVNADVLTLLGTKPDAARRALRTLEAAGLVKLEADKKFEIVSPEPDPVLDDQAEWRRFTMEKYGLTDWPGAAR